MSYQVYKMIHIVSIVIFFSLFAATAYMQKSDKKSKILTGIFLVLILVSGMGLVARIGISHGSGWPTWLYMKLAIWFVVGTAGHVVMKRFPQIGVKTFWGGIALLVCASYLANYKPF